VEQRIKSKPCRKSYSMGKELEAKEDGLTAPAHRRGKKRGSLQVP